MFRKQRVNNKAQQLLESYQLPPILEDLTNRELSAIRIVKNYITNYRIPKRSFGTLWHEHKIEMLRKTILEMDERLFKYHSCMNYQTLKPLKVNLEWCKKEVEKRDNTVNRCIEELGFITNHSKESMTVLEIGCGLGDLTVAMAGIGLKVTVVDFPPMQAMAMFRCLSQGFNVEFIPTSYLPDKKYDLAVSIHSMGEMNDGECLRYLGYIKKNCKAFYSNNAPLENDLVYGFPDFLGWKVGKTVRADYDNYGREDNTRYWHTLMKESL